MNDSDHLITEGRSKHELPTHRSEEVCPRCKQVISPDSYGWVKMYHPHTHHEGHFLRFGYCLIPCPLCAPHVIQKRQFQERDKLFGGANIPLQALEERWSFQTYPSGGDRQVKEKVEAFVEAAFVTKRLRIKRGFYLWGESSRGKTSLAVSALLEAMERYEVHCLYSSTIDFFDQLYSSFSPNTKISTEKVLKVFSEIPFLVLDDLTTEGESKAILKRVFSLVERRKQNLLYTIFTSNRSIDEAEDFWQECDPLYGRRIAERLREYCYEYQIQGMNLRQADAYK